MVSTPSDGGQSMRTTSYVAEDRLERPGQHVLAPGLGQEVHLGARPGRWWPGRGRARRPRPPAGPRRPPWPGGPGRRGGSARGRRGRSRSEKVRQAWGSRSTTRTRRPALGQGHAQRLDGGGLGHAALLVGHGHHLRHGGSLRPAGHRGPEGYGIRPRISPGRPAGPPPKKGPRCCRPCFPAHAPTRSHCRRSGEPRGFLGLSVV